MSIWTTLVAPTVHAPGIPVLSVGNLKGGVGKTTVVANVAMALARMGKRVLAIDLDFQASLSVAIPPNVMPRHETADGGVHVLLSENYDMFHDSRITALGVGAFADLSLVRTSLELADIEDRLFAAFILGERENDPRFALARKLADPRLAQDFDIVIIDTPPRLTMASINALCASTHVLIPTALTSLSLSGAVTFVEYLVNFQNTLCRGINVLGVLPTFTHGELSAPEKSAIATLKKSLRGVEIWDDVFIPTRQDIANNKVLQNEECRNKFKSVAEKIVTKIGMPPNGNNDGHRIRRGSFFSRAGLSQ